MTRAARAIVACAVLAGAACDRSRGPEPAPPAARAPTRAEATVAFASALSTAVAARDAGAIGARFTDDATASLVGDPSEARGRAAIEAVVGGLLARHDGAIVTIGRVWVSDDASVIELVLAGTRRAGPLMGTVVPARPIGVVGAAVVVLDGRGLVRTLRLYVDVVSIVAQIDPARLPAFVKGRAVTTTPPAGTAVQVSAGTAGETRRLALANQVWAGMDAHDPAAVMASAADDYVYEDYAGPAPLDRAATRELVAGFLAAVPDFRIAAKPVQFAAGDDVITEMVEHMTFEGRPIVLHGLDVKRFAGEQVVREWQYASQAEVLNQIRGLPAFDLR